MAYYEEGNLDMLLRKNRGILQANEYVAIGGGLLLATSAYFLYPKIKKRFPKRPFFK